MALAGLAAALLAVSAARAQATSAHEGPIRIVDVVDLAGPGAAASLKWRNGIDLALREINARGGLLGRQVVVEHVDVRTVSAALAHRPYVVLGPNAPESADAAAAAPAGKIPQIVGPGASGAQPSPYLFRMAPDPARQVTKLAEGIARIAKSGSIALVWRDDETGRAHHHALIAALAARQIKLAADIPVAPQQVDFSTSVIRARSAASAALVADLDEEQAARLMRELRRQAYDKPIIGGGAFLRPGVVEAAGDAAGDLHALVGFSVDSPAPTVRDVLAKYERAYGGRGDHPALAGYAALYLAKAVSERAGALDAEAFARAMRGVRLSARDAPGVLLDVGFDGRGTPDYELLIVAIRDGKPVVIDSLPPAGR